MKPLIRVCMTGLVAAMVSPAAASTWDNDMERARAMTATGTSFEKVLAREYRDFFLFEADKMYDWPDADHFAEKSLAANTGQRVAPETISDWDIEGTTFVRELESARAKLVTALSLGAAELAPEQAGVAQARFDCWVEQQEEGWQWDHINACKNQFDAAYDNLTLAMVPPVVPQAAKAPTLEFVPVTEELVIYFDFDDARVSPQSKTSIDRFLETIADRTKVEIVVTGHADRAGSDLYNRQLSERRAEAVRSELIEEGLIIRKLDDLALQAKGESDPALATADGVREQLNRRVVIQGYGLQAIDVTAQAKN